MSQLRPMSTARPTNRLALDGTGDWRDQAACAGRNPETFFSPEQQTAAEKIQREFDAVAICKGCPVAQQCLTATLKAEGDAVAQHRFGVFGAMTASQRHALATGQPIPKLRRPAPEPGGDRAATLTARRALDTRPRPADCAEPSDYGVVRHRRRGELPCWACTTARVAANRARRAAQRAANDARPVTA